MIRNRIRNLGRKQLQKNSFQRERVMIYEHPITSLGNLLNTARKIPSIHFSLCCGGTRSNSLPAHNTHEKKPIKLPNGRESCLGASWQRRDTNVMEHTCDFGEGARARHRSTSTVSQSLCLCSALGVRVCVGWLARRGQRGSCRNTQGKSEPLGQSFWYNDLKDRGGWTLQDSEYKGMKSASEEKKACHEKTRLHNKN